MPDVLLASYNIQKGIGSDFRRDPARALAVLAELDPDIIVLQEADRRFGSRASALPLAAIAARGWRPVPFETRPGSIGYHGNAVLVSPRVEIRRHAALVIPALEPRGAVLADLAIDGAAVRVVGMHLDLSGLWRRRQVRAIIAHIGRLPDDSPAVVMGDMNEWRASAALLSDFSAVLDPVPTGPSFHARMPVAALDRIFISRGVAVLGAGVHRTPMATLASDHLPVWVRLRLPTDVRVAGPGVSSAR